MNKKDIIVDYAIGKSPQFNSTVADVLSLVFAYIQNNEVYFKYEPTEWEGAIIFGIVGTEEKHRHMKLILTAALNVLHCSFHETSRRVVK